MHPDPKVPVVAAIPGGGWQAEYSTESGEFREPVLCWLVYADSEIEAITVDGLGVTSDATDANNFHRLIQPGDDPMNNPTPDDPYRCHHTEPEGRRCNRPTGMYAGWCDPHGRDRTTYTDTRSDSDVLRDVLVAVDQLRNEFRWGFAAIRKELKK